MNTIFLIVAVFAIIKHIDYISKVVSLSSKIIFKNFLGIIFVVMLVGSIFFGFALLPLLVNTSNELILHLRYLSFLMLFWLFFISVYFVQVYISSVIVLEISNEDESSVFKSSFRNACYALGSISYSALLVAIISTLQLMVSDASKRNQRRDDGSNLISRIFSSMALALLSAIGDIAKMANAIALPYLSINGSSYEESVVKSYETLTHSGFENVASLFGIDFLVFNLILLHIGASMFFNYYFVLDYLGVSASSKEFVAFLISLIFAEFAGMVFTLLKFSVIALIFTSILLPNETKKYEPDFFDVLSKKNSEIKPAGDSNPTTNSN